MFSRRATGTAVLIGGLVGTFVSYYVAYHTGISFLWPSAFGLVATMAAAMAITTAGGAAGIRATKGQDLTWYAVMHNAQLSTLKSEI